MIWLGDDPEPWDDAELDADFPLGDGVADMAAEVGCPCCGEPVTIALDPGSGACQEYVEDCQVCCRPWTVRVWYDDAGAATVEVEAADDV